MTKKRKKEKHRHKIKIVNECPYCGIEEGICVKCQKRFIKKDSLSKWEED